MTLKWIRRWARFLDVKLRLDHTLSQSTDKLRSDNSLFQIVLIERGFVIQSRILLYIKETDGRPADGAIQSRIGWEEMEEDQGTPYALRAERNWRKTKYADAGRQNLALNAWNEQRPWLSYISPHVFTPKEDQEGWTNGRFPHTKTRSYFKRLKREYPVSPEHKFYFLKPVKTMSRSYFISKSTEMIKKSYFSLHKQHVLVHFCIVALFSWQDIPLRF